MDKIFGVPTAAFMGQLMLGLVNGSFYALLSLGLAVIFGMLNIVNFAHCALYMAGAFIAFFAFIGFESLANMAEEAKDPRRTIPYSIVGAVLISTLLYVVVASALVSAGAVSEAHSERPDWVCTASRVATTSSVCAAPPRTVRKPSEQPIVKPSSFSRATSTSSLAITCMFDRISGSSSLIRLRARSSSNSIGTLSFTVCLTHPIDVLR